VDALVSRHDCFTIDGDAYIYCQRQRCSPQSVVSGDIPVWLMPIFVGVRWCQMRVWSSSSKMQIFSFDRYIFHMKRPTGLTYQNLHGLRGFLSDSTALVILRVQFLYCNSN